MATSCPPQKFDVAKRTTFGRYAAQVFGWPSSGGVVIKEFANAVDLDFLDVDRFHRSGKAASSAEEDVFCDKLYRIGAKWWQDEDDFNDVDLGMRERTADEERESIFGYPSTGGVWMLSFPTQREIPRDIGRINMARNMEERCAVMKEYGATFFDDADQAPYPRRTQE